jgi:hypothetical protein
LADRSLGNCKSTGGGVRTSQYLSIVARAL